MFLVVAVGIVVAIRSTYAGVGPEAGDFAANSLLVQEAKHFELADGNYSRVGFNHPGPAFLYVLAMGEGVFHDLLHVATWPLQGQLIAVALLTAGWIVVVLYLLRLGFPGWRRPLLGVALLVTLSALTDYQFMAGLWFPHLYYWPFAVFVLAAGFVGAGEHRALIPLAVSAGFLVNGHVSFVSTLGIIGLAVLVGNMVTTASDRERRIASRRYVKLHSRSILVAVGIFAIFLVPLAVRLLRDFPHPLSDYWGVARSHAPNTWRQAVTYTAQYWGGDAGLATGVVLALIVIVARMPNDTGADRLASSVAIACLGGTGAMLLYSRNGVDLLDQRYIGYFYSAVPLITLVALILKLSPFLVVPKPARLVVPAALVVFGAVTYHLTTKPVQYAPIYNVSDGPALASELERLGGGRRVSISVPASANWGVVWSTLLGAEVDGARRGRDLFCLTDSWHISFTAKARCTDAENINARHIVLTTADAGVPAAVVGDIRVFDPNETPRVARRGYQSAATFTRLDAPLRLGSGWSNSTGEPVWSVGRKARLSVLTERGARTRLMLDLHAYAPPGAPAQSVEVWFRGRRIANALFRKGPSRQRVIAVLPKTADPVVVVDLRIAAPRSPRSLGQSPDNRELGVGLNGYQITSA